jgi:hypothetical protein
MVRGRNARIVSVLWLVVLKPYLEAESYMVQTKEGGNKRN